MPADRDVVSTIIPVYNRPTLLIEAVASVLAQTYRPIEVVIVDDGSTDATGEVAEELARIHPREVRLIRQDNRGFAGARNAGLESATGEFIQFLDSDDLLMPEKFSTQVAGLKENPECGISYCATRVYRLGELPLNRAMKATGRTLEGMFPDILLGRLWATVTPLYRRQVTDSVGFFRHVSVYEDWEYECRAAASGVRLHHAAGFLADKRDVHALEGRSKGGIPRPKLPEYVEVLESVFASASRARVPAASLDRFSRNVLSTARHCAHAGLREEAQRCVELSTKAAARGTTKSAVAVYRAASQVMGWQRVGRSCESLLNSSLAVGLRTMSRQPKAIWFRWEHRVRVAARTVAGHSLNLWPRLLIDRWSVRESRYKRIR